MINRYSPILAAALAGSVSTVNDMGVIYPRYDGNPGSFGNGMVAAANDANFDAQFLSQPLTEYIVGAPEDEGLEDILNQVAPPVPVGRRFAYRQHNTAEQFQQDADDDSDIREIGGDFKQIRRTGTQTDGATDNKGLIMVLDNDQGGEEPSIQQRAVLNLRSRLLRSELVRVFNLLGAACTTAGAVQGINFGTANAAVDPDMEMASIIDLGGDARGIDSNTVVMGKLAWLQRKKAYRRQLTAGAIASAGMSEEEIATELGVDAVSIVRNRKQLTATTKGKILAGVIYSYFANKVAMPDDPSNIKRFITPAGISAEDSAEGKVGGSAPVRVYIKPELKKTLVVVEHYSRIVVTSTLGIQQINVTYTS